jgi:hypothetical protein
MTSIALICLLLLLLTTIVHYEVLRMLSRGLPMLEIAPRNKLIAVLLVAYCVHVLEILVYALAFYAVVQWFDLGTLHGEGGPQSSLKLCFYFSAETYTSLGYGDVRPTGPLRLLAGAEALNGLLLIGWSASYVYISMERFWKGAEADGQ